MKKAMIYTITLLLITIVTVGATYAFFSATATSQNALLSNSHQLDVIYQGDTEISGNLDLVKSKEGGHNRTVSIQLGTDSVGASANLYISIGEISSTLATEALNWEIYQIENGEETFIDSGTFLDCGAIGETKSKCTNGARIYMITDYVLSTEPAVFKVYIWLNGYLAGNEVLGATLTGYIGAETQNISGILS